MKKIKKNNDSEGDVIFEEVEVMGQEVQTLIDLYDRVDNLEDNEPKDKRSKQYKTWVSTINKAMKEANALSGSKIYTLIK